MHNKINTNISAQVNVVTVIASARLHMGFFDLRGGAIRKFGSLGLSIDAPYTQVVLTKSDKTIIDANCSKNDIKIIDNIAKLLKVENFFSLDMLQSIPQHVGLGSGTQMALAIGAGLNALFDLNLTVSQIAKISRRGARSGIGIAAFEQGGVLVDDGKVNDELPEIALRQAFSEDWRVLLITDSAYTGIHGEAELQAFKSLNPAQHSLRDMVFEQMLPALECSDLLTFGKHMATLQAYNGTYFAPIQGGHYASQYVATVLQWLQHNGVTCVGQSSWGPTGFAIVENAAMANNLLPQLQQKFSRFNNISFQIVRGKNSGANIQLG
jgi:beta-ribofuranosylaminobenzene 5'-phosphate synthase